MNDYVSAGIVMEKKSRFVGIPRRQLGAKGWSEIFLPEIFTLVNFY